jgi:hypothetical protein
MDFEIEFLPVGDASKAGDAIVVRYGSNGLYQVIVVDGGTDDAGDPAAADEAYRSATEWLKERCRDKKFALVHKENIEYGFRRNMRGVRPFAISANLFALMGTLVVAWYRVSAEPVYSLSALTEHVPTPVFGVILLLSVSLIFWIAFVRDDWVRQAGDQYARALLATCESL